MEFSEKCIYVLSLSLYRPSEKETSNHLRPKKVSKDRRSYVKV